MSTMKIFVDQIPRTESTQKIAFTNASEAVNLLIKQFRTFVLISDLEALECSFEIIGSNLEKNRNRKSLRQPRGATLVVRFPFENSVCLSVPSECFTKNVEDDLRLIRDCSNPVVTKYIGTVGLLGSAA